MRRTSKPRRGGRLSVGDQKAAAVEVARLVAGYVRQETLDPLKGLAKRAVFSLAAVALLAIGFVAALLGLLRVLQTETGRTFAGSWNFAPYLLTAVAALLVIGAAAALGLRAGAGQKR